MTANVDCFIQHTQLLKHCKMLILYERQLFQPYHIIFGYFTPSCYSWCLNTNASQLKVCAKYFSVANETSLLLSVSTEDNCVCLLFSSIFNEFSKIFNAQQIHVLLKFGIILQH